MYTIVTGEGKYITTNNNGVLSVLRNKVDWNRNFLGDGYVLSLVQRIEDLERQVYDLMPKTIDIPDYNNFNQTVDIPDYNNFHMGLS